MKTDDTAKPTLADVLEHMVFSTRANTHACAAACRNGVSVRIARGVYLSRTYLRSLPMHHAVRAVELARCVAASRARPAGVLAGVAAAIAHGADPPGVVTQIEVNVERKARGSGGPVLPAVVLPSGFTVPSAAVRLRTRTLPSTWTATAGEAIRLLNMRATLVWIALLDRTEQGFGAACTLLGRLSRFDTRASCIDQSRARERQEVDLVRQGIEFLRDFPDKDEALRFADAIDGACAPGGECRFLWLLHERDLGGVVTQHVVWHEGAHRRVDFAFPAFRLVIEFDGMGKYPEDKAELKAALADQEARNRFLDRAGWRVIRFSTDDLRDPDRVEREIRASMSAAADRWDIAVADAVVVM